MLPPGGGEAPGGALPAGVSKSVSRQPPCETALPPQAGDEVELHYVAKAGENVFDSTRERGEPFKGKLDHQEGLPPCLGACVRGMRKGERSVFTVPPEHAYGEAGLEGRVPPSCAVVLDVELLGCPKREDLFDDGGAVKLELRAKPDGRRARANDEVQVSVKVTVDGGGIALESQSIAYKMGSGQLGQIARVMDRALETMTRGDEVVITCQPSYAFGSGEGPYAGKVARIALSLEEIFEVHDVSLGRLDRAVLRKRIKEGGGSHRCHDTALVKVRVDGVEAAGEEVLHASRELSFVAGDGAVCDALEGAVDYLREGDEAILRVESPEACAGGLLGLPDDLRQPIMIRMAMLSVEKVKEKWDLNGPERIERGRARKEVAGRLFKAGRTRLACRHYEAIAGLYSDAGLFRGAEGLAEEAAELRRVANLNRAMCLLKMGDMPLVKELCGSVLKEDATNSKALFRRARASLALEEYAEAIEDLERLLEVEPSSVEGRNLLREAKRLRKEHDRYQTNAFARMCSGLGHMPERTDRRDDDIVERPNMDEELSRILQRAPRAPAAPPACAPGGAAAEAAGEPAGGAPAEAARGDLGGS